MNYFVPTSAAKNAANHTGKRKKKKTTKISNILLRPFAKMKAYVKILFPQIKKKSLKKISVNRIIYSVNPQRVRSVVT